MNIKYNLQFDKMCEYLGLGMLLCPPEQLFGGHLHRMYAITTTTGKYAVKAVNPQVMLRPEAKQNINNAERISQTASKHIHALPAKLFDGVCIPEIDGQYYLIFDWIDGDSIFSEQISISHCEQIGSIFAQLHKIDFSALCFTDDYYADEKLIDWLYYLREGEKTKADWSKLFKENIENIIVWNTRLIEAAAQLSTDTIISHGDLEPKNVMWQNNNPILIDWEAAGFIHPMHDLIETALYWSDENGIKKHKFMAFVKGYRDITGILNADWPVVLDKGLGGKLGWLEYSLKRSLGIECTDEAEQKMGTDHVFGTIKILHDYNDMKKQIIEWIT